MRPAPLLVALALVAGCRHYSQEDGEKLAAQVYALETQLQATQKALRDAEGKLGTHDAQVADLTSKVDAMHTVAFKSAADFGVQLDNALQELARLKGLSEGSKERLDAIESQLAKVSDEFKLSEEKRLTVEQTADEKKKAVEEAIRRERLISDPAALTAEVVRLMNERKIADARKLLREAVQRSDAGQADKLKKELDALQFLIAETYYLEGNYQLAATEYNAVRKNFPKSDQVPEALFKMGQCFESLKLPEDAKLFYRTVVEKHARSAAAKKAKERLAALK